LKFRERARRTVLLATAVFGTASCFGDAGPFTDMDAEMAPASVFTSGPVLRAAMLEEEDARGTGASGIEFLREGLIAPDAGLQRVAVRGIGRLENPRFIPITFPLLFSGDEIVRAEAVNALGQAAFGSLGDDVADVLFDYLVRESGEGPAVRAVIGRTLGRLRYADTGRFRRAEETLLDLTRAGGGDAPLVTLLGAVMGLESMARLTGRGRMSEAAVERLRELAALGRGADAPGAGEGSVSDPLRLGDPVRVRRVAMMALSAIGQGAKSSAHVRIRGFVRGGRRIPLGDDIPLGRQSEILAALLEESIGIPVEMVTRSRLRLRS
jgi:hypothetical protein